MSALLSLPSALPAARIDIGARRAAYELARALAEERPLEQRLRTAVAACRELFGAAEAVLLLTASDSPAISTSSGAAERTRRAPAHTVYCAPLFVAGEPVGVLKLVNPGGAQALSDEEVLLLSTVARDLGNALGESRERPSRELDPSTNVFRCEGDFWTVAHAGVVARVKDTKGMRLLALLLESPGRELHALDMVAGPDASALGSQSSGDSLLDAKSRSAYRDRLAELNAELDLARAQNDTARMAQSEAELGFLIAELRRCVGFAGRTRTVACAAERARQNVTRSIRSAMRRLEAHNGALAGHFERTIRTGLFCSYEPDPRAPIEWEL
jgi:hypothetical protein